MWLLAQEHVPDTVGLLGLHRLVNVPVLSRREYGETGQIAASALFVAGLCVAYLVMPLVHHVGFTDGYYYISDKDNFFSWSWVLQAVAAVVTRLRGYWGLRGRGGWSDASWSTTVTSGRRHRRASCTAASVMWRQGTSWNVRKRLSLPSETTSWRRPGNGAESTGSETGPEKQNVPPPGGTFWSRLSVRRVSWL